MFGGVPLDTIAFAAFLAFCRIGACFMLMPGLSSMRVPMHVRLFVAVAVTWALLIHLWDAIIPGIEAGTSDRIRLVASELLIGGTIGLVTRFYVLALQFSATAIAQMAGFNTMASVAIEEIEPQSALTVFITFFALMLLFIFDFHHEVLKALVISYDVAPLDTAFNAQAALIDVADTLSQSFYLTLRLASPFIAYGILVNLALGFVNKLAPQIPVYFVSLPFIIFGALVLLYFGIGLLLALFADGFVPTTVGL